MQMTEMEMIWYIPAVWIGQDDDSSLLMYDSLRMLVVGYTRLSYLVLSRLAVSIFSKAVLYLQSLLHYLQLKSRGGDDREKSDD